MVMLDSDSGFLRVVCKRLEAAGWEHRILGSPVPVDAIVALRPNAIVLDLVVLGSSPWSFLEALSGRLRHVGLVVCTGRSSMAERVRGLRMGADDWITKPCHPEELIARVEAVVRRRKRAAPRVDDAPVVAGELEIRADRFQAFVRGVSVDLTRREFDLILLLAEAEGRVLEREEIYQHVWGYAMVRADRSVDVFVHKLRKKLERVSPAWLYIHTQFAIGYRFAAEPVDRAAGASVPAPAAVRIRQDAGSTTR
jgi:DNA-binding response OmpR family regulator